MTKTETHFCDYCHKEVWGVEVRKFDNHEFCSSECEENYCFEKEEL